MSIAQVTKSDYPYYPQTFLMPLYPNVPSSHLHAPSNVNLRRPHHFVALIWLCDFPDCCPGLFHDDMGLGVKLPMSRVDARGSANGLVPDI